MKKVNPEDTHILNVTDHQQSAETMRLFLVGLEIFLGIIGGITLLVAGVGISNVMLISVKQNIRDIGSPNKDS